MHTNKVNWKLSMYKKIKKTHKEKKKFFMVEMKRAVSSKLNLN